MKEGDLVRVVVSEPKHEAGTNPYMQLTLPPHAEELLSIIGPVEEGQQLLVMRLDDSSLPFHIDREKVEKL